MLNGRYLWLCLLWLALVAGSARARQNTEEVEKNLALETCLKFFYNNISSVEKIARVKTMAEEMIVHWPDDPWLYELWASIEWSAVSLEMEVGFDERRNILGIPPYRHRAEKYHTIVAKGIQLADQKLAEANGNGQSRQQWLFAKGALCFADAKFFAKFEFGRSGLEKSDEASAQGIREFKKILAENAGFYPVFLYIGGARYQISNQGFAIRTLIRFTSYTFAEINTICEGDVVNKNESVQWLERSYTYGAPQPWLKKNLVDTAFVLQTAYERLRINAGLNRADEKEYIRNKELPVLLWLQEQFPENEKLQDKRKLLELRLSWK